MILARIDIRHGEMVKIIQTTEQIVAVDSADVSRSMYSVMRSCDLGRATDVGEAKSRD